MRKTLFGIVTVVLCLGLSIAALAASGYSSRKERDPAASDPDTAVASSADAAPTESQVAGRAETAIGTAIETGSSSAVVSFREVSSLSAESIQRVAQQAEEAGVDAAIHVDRVEERIVLSRMYIDPALAGELTGPIDTTVSIGGSAATLFGKYFVNDLAVVTLGHQGSFGMPVKLAALVDLSELDPDNLVFYVYNIATNTFARIAEPSYFIDANGYLHFTTGVGGSVIISEGALAKA